MLYGYDQKEVDFFRKTYNTSQNFELRDLTHSIN